MYEIEPIHELEDRPDLVIAELLGVINKMANGNQRLENIIRTYEVMATNYDRKLNELLDERDRARELAVMLEQECNRCWGPVHSKTIEEIKLGAFYSEGWDDDGA